MDKWKLFALVTFILISIVGFFMVRGNDYSLTKLRIQSGYVVDIRVPYSWEVTQPVSCRVIKNKDIIFPLRMIGTTLPTRILEFAIIESEDDLVAVIEKTHPHVILAIYDLTNQKMWPSSEGWEQDYAIGKELLHRLDPRRKGFVLGSLE